MYLSGMPTWKNTPRDELRNFDWKGVADMLTGPQFRALRSVKVCLAFAGELEYDGWEKLIRARWSDFAERGILVLKKQHGFEK